MNSVKTTDDDKHEMIRFKGDRNGARPVEIHMLKALNSVVFFS